MHSASKTPSVIERYRELTLFWRWVVVIFAAIGMLLAVSQIFYLNLLGVSLLDNSYMYALIAIFLSLVFIVFPSKKGARATRGFLFWVDVLLVLITLSISISFTARGHDIINEGWLMQATTPYIVMSVLLWFITIEAVRRSVGLVLAVIVTFFSFFPLFTGYMPAFLKGATFTFTGTAIYHAFSTESLVGIPMRVFSELIIGFMIFGVALMSTGGGKFFLDFASALLGHTRGGAAKVAVAASALFGSMSGSAISNVITTGSMTIPAMKRTGYPPYFAAAVEACSSTGGVLMPPIMGATAFVMASFLNLPYLSIAIAAAIPSILYYSGLMIQVDGHAARNNLVGLPRAQLPSLKQTLKEGWFYLFALALLMIFLFLRVEAQAPFYATAFLLLCTNIRKETRLNFEKLKEFCFQTGRLLAELVAILSAVGLIIGSLAMTGVAHAFSGEIVYLAGGNIALLLLLGALSSFILGMGMTITACYVFLAVVLAPALVQAGLNQLAVHMFVMYCGMMSFITPPVGLSIYPAATIAGAGAIKTGITAVRLGLVTFLVPFFFVLNPALILQGAPLEIAHVVISALIGTIILASALEGYIVGVGTLSFARTSRLKNVLLRLGIFVSGVLLAIPETQTDWIGLVMGACIIIPMLIIRHKGKLNASSTKMDE